MLAFSGPTGYNIVLPLNGYIYFVASFTNGRSHSATFNANYRSKIATYFMFLWGIIANGEIFKFDGGFCCMSSHLTIVGKTCAAFYRDSTWICVIASYSNANDWGTLVTAASISSGVQSCPTETGHPTRAYCSNKFSSGWRLALHLGNTIPHNFPPMTSYRLVNSSSNHRRSSANAVAGMFIHQCRVTLSRFWCWLCSCRQRARLALFLRLAPDQECMSDLCLKFSARNCGWAVWLKSILLACVIDCAIVLRLSLLTLLMLQLLASKLSYACSRLIQQFSYLLHCTWGHQVDRPPHPSIRLHHPLLPLLPCYHCCRFSPLTPPEFPLELFPHSSTRGW